ncbi:unnamed protein product [Nesidiocoris tenuis]|uniref:Uncharacterized protein n=1 Tax=Nesidiocoris tenuis TaxID=355587 RepID=A0A6H5GQ45_9HEMI|nr:unnamed protein product [Nesidiocoris tenuis]
MDFKFSRVNYKSLDGLLNQEDRPAFSIDQTNIDPIELYKLNAYGMVKYAVGEDFAPDALQKRKKRYAMSEKPPLPQSGTRKLELSRTALICPECSIPWWHFSISSLHSSWRNTVTIILPT